MHAFKTIGGMTCRQIVEGCVVVDGEVICYFKGVPYKLMGVKDCVANFRNAHLEYNLECSFAIAQIIESILTELNNGE